MSDSRTTILESIRKSQPQIQPKPDLTFEKQSFEDPVEHFCHMVEAVGGTAEIVQDAGQVSSLIKLRPEDKVLSNIEAIQSQNVKNEEILSAHDMQDIDWCCFHAELGVAENGSLLTLCNDFKFRSVYFLAQNLIVTVNKDDIVDNMHAAYDTVAKLNPESFYAFISGPSKTADIEQSLVIGAHGARSLKVFIKTY